MEFDHFLTLDIIPKLKKKYDDKVKNFVLDMAKSPQVINDFKDKNYVPQDLTNLNFKLTREFETDRVRVVNII